MFLYLYLYPSSHILRCIDARNHQETDDAIYEIFVTQNTIGVRTHLFLNVDVAGDCCCCCLNLLCVFN